MAKVLGESGRYVSQEAARKHDQFIKFGFGGMLVIGLVMGYLLCLWLQARQMPALLFLLTETILLGIVLTLGKFGLRKLADLEKQRLSWRKGAVGEALVGLILQD